MVNDFTDQYAIALKGNTSDLEFLIYIMIDYVAQFVTINVIDLFYTDTPENICLLAIGENYKAH